MKFFENDVILKKEKKRKKKPSCPRHTWKIKEEIQRYDTNLMTQMMKKTPLFQSKRRCIGVLRELDHNQSSCPISKLFRLNWRFQFFFFFSSSFLEKNQKWQPVRFGPGFCIFGPGPLVWTRDLDLVRLLIGFFFTGPKPALRAPFSLGPSGGPNIDPTKKKI